MDPSKIRGDIGRSYGPEPEKQDDKIDPEKFKKVLKVDESDQAQKRHKRNLKKEEEEGEEEEITEEKSPNAATAFSEFMDDSEKLDSLYDSESGGTRRVETPETSSPYAPKPPKPISADSGESDEELLPPLPETPSESPISPPPQMEASPPETPEDDSSLLANQPEKGSLKPKRKTAKKKAKPKEVLVSPSKKEIKNEPKVSVEKKEKPPIETPTTKIEKPAYASFKKHTIESIRERKKESALGVAEEEVTSPVPSDLQGNLELNKKKKDEDFVEANLANAGLPHTHIPETLPPLENSDMPRYTQLSPDVYELFERTTGVIYIVEHADKSSTSVTINMPNTVYNGAELVIDRYSTAPMAFNVQLIGSPEAVKSFEANLEGLKSSFDEAQYNFEVNLLTPILQTEKKKPLIRRSGSAGGGGGGGKKGKQ